MRAKGWLFSGFIILLLVVAGVSLWILRQPIKQSLDLIRPAASSSWQFAVVGDNHGVNPIYQQIVSELIKQPPEFLLALGDNTEHGTAAELTAVKKLEDTLPFPVYHTLGSHDIKTDGAGQTFRDVLGQTANAVYHLRNLWIITVDNAERKVGFSDQTLGWLETQLNTTGQDPVIIVYHRPFGLPLASLLGDDETSASSRSNEKFTTLIGRYPNIKYIFSAHLHTYLPYTVGSTPAVVSGGGGDPAQTVLGGASQNYFHYLLVTIDDSAISIHVQRVVLQN